MYASDLRFSRRPSNAALVQRWLSLISSKCSSNLFWQMIITTKRRNIWSYFPNRQTLKGILKWSRRCNTYLCTCILIMICWLGGFHSVDCDSTLSWDSIFYDPLVVKYFKGIKKFLLQLKLLQSIYGRLNLFFFRPTKQSSNLNFNLRGFVYNLVSAQSDLLIFSIVN